MQDVCNKDSGHWVVFCLPSALCLPPNKQGTTTLLRMESYSSTKGSHCSTGTRRLFLGWGVGFPKWVPAVPVNELVGPPRRVVSVI